MESVRAILRLLFTASGFSDPVAKLDGPVLEVGLLVESERTILFLAVAVSCGPSNPTDELEVVLLVESDRTIFFLAAAVSCGCSNPTDELDAPDLATEDGAESDSRFLCVLMTSCL